MIYDEETEADFHFVSHTMVKGINWEQAVINSFLQADTRERGIIQTGNNQSREQNLRLNDGVKWDTGSFASKRL